MAYYQRMTSAAPLIDAHDRAVRYVRLSVTDRCDLRCTYCMPRDQKFAPRHDLLSLEELDRLASLFVAHGVDRIRITGGEPLVRSDTLPLMRRLSRHLETGLSELLLTTNGTRLARHADDLAALGMRRVNVSLDSLDPNRFAAITRLGQLDTVLEGIAAAKAAGLRIKINMVVDGAHNADEVVDMVQWAHGEGHDIVLIEKMPMASGAADAEYLSLATVKERLAERWTLQPTERRTAGPSRYYRVKETGGDIGFIAPMSGNFCASCNRIRITANGRLYPCLGHDLYFDFRHLMRSGGDDTALAALIGKALRQKPAEHDFVAAISEQRPAVSRAMAVTGG
ncbi:GTP 3',8-cyclase MoaA [Alterisphingorhabdus coralli]|uniref:GTP 3',8-cyclase n=1 Tax=Alterisphingorhabdus coralli TaxID=3071408 RepID=A0AA97I164_9SPHN|nr:GTP 3',8-cyclase MoaA [Parasphingorhabdus sp. SCSIO 66989]WOE74955.1 GTP 3',8-cyclase MoaA [Parasphingorhabdus sp. SCSIO 66989]